MTTLLTNKGIESLMGIFFNGTGTPPVHVGWGTGTTDAVATDTALQTPASPARTSGTKTQVTTNTTNDTYQVVATITAGGTLAITEAGLFDGAGTGLPPTGANLYVRGVFAAINLVSGDSIQFTIKIVLDQA